MNDFFLTRGSRDPGREPSLHAHYVTRRRTDLGACERATLLDLAARHHALTLRLSCCDGSLVSPRHPFVARRNELPHFRLQRHGVATLRLLRALVGDAWTLTDGDPGNFAWSEHGPILIDWGSPVPRVPVNAPWTGLRQFAETVLFPLALSVRTGVPPARWLTGYPDGIDAATTQHVLGLRAWRGPAWLITMLFFARGQPYVGQLATRRRSHRGDALRWLAGGLLRAVEGLRPPRQRWCKTQWASHRAADSYTQRAAEARHDAVARHSREHQPRRLVDLGAHTGALLACALAQTRPEHSIALDSDPGCANFLCERFADAAVTVVETDILDNLVITPRIRGFRADMTIVCGLIHHLALGRGHGLRYATEVIRACCGPQCGASAVVEWIPASDAQLCSLYDHCSYRSPQLNAYRLDIVLDTFGPQWTVNSVTIAGSERVLLHFSRHEED